MINLYEKLGLSNTATVDEIQKILNSLVSQNKISEAQFNTIKGVLLNTENRAAYDQKLLHFLMNSQSHVVGIDPKLHKDSTSNHSKLETVSQSTVTNNKTDSSVEGQASGKSIKFKKAQNPTLDKIMAHLDAEIHDYYIWAVFALIIFSTILSFFISVEADLKVTGLVAVVTIVLLSLDWKMLEKNGKSIFTRWWFLLTPVYLFKRSKALETSQQNLFIWLGIFITCIGLSVALEDGIEEDACVTVTEIIQKQLYRPNVFCTSVTITNSRGKVHNGLAELSNGRAVDILVTETDNNNIWVEVLD